MGSKQAKYDTMRDSPCNKACKINNKWVDILVIQKIELQKVKAPLVMRKLRLSVDLAGPSISALITGYCIVPWAPAGRGKGALSPEKVVKCFVH